MAPTTSDASASTLRMKLLVDTNGAGRVLYAEAGKDVVDFIFSLLALPVGTAVKLLGKESMVGCIGNVYASVEDLNGTYVEPGAAKDALLRPTVMLSPAAGAKGSSLFRLPAPPPPSAPPCPKKFFRCINNRKIDCYDYDHKYNRTHNCRDYITDVSGWECPSCGGHMNTEAEFLSSAAGSGQSVEAEATAGNNANGLVRGVVTYTVMDDLKVAPMSTISSITLLNAFGITDIGALKEKTVQLGYAEILRQSLQSKTVLTRRLLEEEEPKGLRRFAPDAQSEELDQ